MKLSKLPKEVKSYYYISSVVYTLLRVLAMTSPLLMKVIVDDAIPSQDFNTVILWIILFCSIPIATTLVDVLYFRWINGVIWSNSLKVNHRVFTNMIDQPLSYFSEKDTGELINLYKSDVTQLYSYYLIERPKLVSQGLVALLVLFSLYALSPTIALIQLILIPLIIFPTRGIFNKISIISSELFKNNGQRIGLVTECLRNIKSVKVNLFSSFYTARLSNYHKDLVEIWKKIFTFDILATAWGNSFVGPFNLAVSFIFAVSAVVNGNMTLGSLILVISYTPVFCNFLVTYASTNIQLANKNEEFTKVLQLSAAESTLNQGSKTEIKAIDSIAFEEVGFSYNENDLLKGMNFNLKKGDVLHIKGANGSGKSTLLDLLIGLKEAKSGTIKINGHPIDSVDLLSYYRRTAYMIQDIELPTLSLRAYFKLHNPVVDDEAIYKALKSVHIDVDSLKAKDGLDTTIVTTVSNFSGGEKRKLVLAAMLIKDSDLIILDEFTANADVASINAMKGLLKEIITSKDKIIILVSHDTDFKELSNYKMDLSVSESRVS